jgi:hypothetical protein
LPAWGADNPPAAALSCKSTVPDALPAGNQKFKLVVSEPGGSTASPDSSLRGNGAVWQPRGGEILFTISDPGGSAVQPAKIIACFRWHGSKAVEDWQQSSMPLRIVDNGQAKGQGTITYAARIPQLPNAPLEWWGRVTGSGHEEDYVGFWIVPLADLRVMATLDADGKALDVLEPIGITSLKFSFLAAGLGIVAAWTALYWFGRWRQVPGNDIVMKLISTKTGVGSLSQLQIILWTFVVGASGIYVMALSGDLIDISNGTLVLLGITGAATVGSKLQSHQADQAGNPPPSAAPPPTVPAAPGAVQVLGLAPGSAPTESEVRLSWAPPVGGGPPARYLVQYRESGVAGAGWSVASSTVEATALTVVGLASETIYDFQVTALNAGGPGAASPILTPAATAAAPVPPAAAPAGRVANLTLRPDISNGGILRLFWASVPGANRYHVQYRVHDSDESWFSDRDAYGTIHVIRGLSPNTLYDVRVAPANGQASGVWSAFISGTTGPRTPLWSDLVVSSDNGNTVDTARVQMLFFTVVGALFVALKVITTNQIPEIPPGFLLLMGISNGLYLAAKFVPG